MEATFERLCAEHDLTAISVLYQPQFQTQNLVAYIHWGKDGCISGRGDTFEEAFSNAIKEMRDNRDEAAWIQRQQDFMESGGPDDSAYRRNMIAAGRGHLLGDA